MLAMDELVNKTQKIKVEQIEDYLLVTISDVVITSNRALEILGTIAKYCKKYDCNKVLLDERTVQRRDVSGAEILDVSVSISKLKLYKVYIAFWCKKELIDEKSGMLRIFTQTDEFMIQHFSQEHHAVNWLNSKP